MNKFIIGLSVIIVIAFGWLALQGSTFSYVSTVSDEAAALEADLIKIDAEVKAGQMSPAQATEARATIAARLEKINAAVEESGSKDLSKRQQAALIEGLDKLKNILIKYQATISFVDRTAEAKPPLKSSRGKTRNSVVEVLAETIYAVEAEAIVNVENYAPTEPEPNPETEEVVVEEEVVAEPEETGTTTENGTEEEISTETSEELESTTTVNTDTPEETDISVEAEATLGN